MKNIIKAITLGAIVFAVCYLFGAFIMLDLNIYRWSFDIRLITGVLFFVTVSCILVLLALNEYY